MKCPWYEDGMCVFDIENSECIEEYTTIKCSANPSNKNYKPLKMEEVYF